jgi:predicted AAA+ superfamily ATPase
MSYVIKRNIYLELEKHLSVKEITMITGARQVGKTTLMQVLAESVRKKNEKILFLNLDFEPDKIYFTSQTALLNKIKLEFGNTNGYVFIDEIQRKENAGVFLKGLYDLDLPYKFIVTGSGSLELKEKIHESLVGRKRIFEIPPVSFLEFVNYQTKYKYSSNLHLFFQVETEWALNLLNDYLNFGGYPRIILESNLTEKIKLMNEIYRSYLEKDIISLLKIEKVEAFSLLIRILASQMGQILNYSRLATECNLSIPSLKKYLWLLEKTFIIQTIQPYFKNIRKEITKSPVLYFLDCGLRNFTLGLFGNNKTPQETGFLFQNFVCACLLNRIQWQGWQLQFWRTTDKSEVDFIINKHTEIIPVEVKYTQLKVPKIKRSLHSFINKYQPKRALVVNLTLKERITVNHTVIDFIPYYELSEINLG